MVLLQRLLLLPLLAPLLVVLLVGALNPRPSLALRLLVWTSPALPIGVWIALAAGGGAGLSAAGAALALGTAPGGLRRKVRRSPRDPRPTWSEDGQEPWEEAADRTPPPRQSTPAAQGPSAGPPRAPGDPAPTVAVPFRVIRKGRPPASPPAQDPSGPEPVVTQAAAVGDGWDGPANDDW